MINLQYDDEQQLIAELNRLQSWNMGGIPGEKSVLSSAGLTGDTINTLFLIGSPIVDAQNVITHLKGIRHLHNRPEYTALGALVQHLLTNAPDLEGKTFLASLLFRYRMIDNEEYLEKLRREYSLAENDPIDKEIEPPEQVTYPSGQKERWLVTAAVKLKKCFVDNWQRVVSRLNRIKKKIATHRLLYTGVIMFIMLLTLFWLIKSITSPLQVDIEKFLIEENGTTTTVAPNAEITATVGDIMKVRVDISSPEQGQEENLAFIWHTCRGGENPVSQSVGNPELFYTTPIKPGPDCIRVTIEQKGLLLDKSEISVNVER